MLSPKNITMFFTCFVHWSMWTENEGCLVNEWLISMREKCLESENMKVLAHDFRDSWISQPTHCSEVRACIDGMWSYLLLLNETSHFYWKVKKDSHDLTLACIIQTPYGFVIFFKVFYRGVGNCQEWNTSKHKIATQFPKKNKLNEFIQIMGE